MSEETVHPEANLLWPTGSDPQAQKVDLLPDHAAVDLGILTLIGQLEVQPRLREKLRAILLTPVLAPDVIRYRQDILADCLDNPPLVAGLNVLLPRLAHLSYLSDYPFSTSLQLVAARLGELEVYVECVNLLLQTLENPQISLYSAGLTGLRDRLRALAASPDFQDLAAHLPGIRASAASVNSITIGVNLDDQLRPYEATLLSVNSQPFTGRSDNFLSRLLSDESQSNGQRGIARLHTVPDDIRHLPENVAGKRPTPLLFPLFQDLDTILRRTIEPVARDLQRYIYVKSRCLVDLEIQFSFYLAGAGLVERMRAAGLPMCRPEIADCDERVCQMKDFYNLGLALRLIENHPDLSQTVVTNYVEFGEAGRILILTGPNQGGKTTFTQAVGMAQALFQAGYYVPARQACISPVDAIFTHFPLEEKPQAESGRLGEEAERLSAIFQNATRSSLVLLNESLTTTSPAESLYLARDVLRALRLWGVRAIFVTHFHELAESIEDLHASTQGDSRFASLVAGIAPGEPADETGEGARRTFKILPGPPMGLSYARDIAQRYGISYEQLRVKSQRVKGQ